MNPEESGVHSKLPENPRGQESRRHDIYPSTERPAAVSGSLIEHTLRAAKRDFRNVTAADVDAAIDDAQPGDMESHAAPEAHADLARVKMHAMLSGRPVAEARAMEHEYGQKYGIDLAHPEKNPLHKKALLALLTLVGVYKPNDYRYTKEDAALPDAKGRGYRLAELAVDDPSALAAIQRTEKGLAELKLAISTEFGVSPDEHENVGPGAKKFADLFDHSPAFQSEIRRYRVAEQQLERLLEENDVKES